MRKRDLRLMQNRRVAIGLTAAAAAVACLWCVVAFAAVGAEDEEEAVFEWHFVRSRCLDGTRGGYYAKWRPSGLAIVHLPGGGWCGNEKECEERSKTSLGSTLHNRATVHAPPDPYGSFALFREAHGASLVSLHYCDGGSYAGERGERGGLYYEGRGILLESLSSVLATSPSPIHTLLLTGCSAGGLGVIHACAAVRSLLVNVDVRCANDGSAFFGNMSSVLSFHNASFSHADGLDLLIASESPPFFTSADIWDWDFWTSPKCKADPSRCTAAEAAVHEGRKRKISLLSNSHISNSSAHCRLGAPHPSLQASLISWATMRRQ